MKTQYTENALTQEERETVIVCSRTASGDYEWTAETSIQPHITKLKKAGLNISEKELIGLYLK